MTYVAVSKPAVPTGARRVERPKTLAGVLLEDTSWGYIIERKRTGVTANEIIVAGAWALGIALLVSAFGMLVSPVGYDSTETIVMKGGLALLVAAIGVRLVWYSSRGTETELQVDLTLGEVRQVVRNKVGKPTLLSKYAFEDIGSVFIDRRKGLRSNGVLLLRYKNTTKLIQAAIGPVLGLEAMRDRLGRDFLEYRLRQDFRDDVKTMRS